MELVGYYITFAQIKGKNNILEDAISRLKMLEIYKDSIEDTKMLKASALQQHITQVNTNKIHNLNSNELRKNKILLVKLSFRIPL